MDPFSVNRYCDILSKLRRPRGRRESWENVLSSTAFRRGIQSAGIHGLKLHKSHSEGGMRWAVIRLSKLTNGLQKLDNGIWKCADALQKLDDALWK
jgi:hypothetical protein